MSWIAFWSVSLEMSSGLRIIPILRVEASTLQWLNWSKKNGMQITGTPLWTASNLHSKEKAFLQLHLTSNAHISLVFLHLHIRGTRVEPNRVQEWQKNRESSFVSVVVSVESSCRSVVETADIMRFSVGKVQCKRLTLSVLLRVWWRVWCSCEPSAPAVGSTPLTWCFLPDCPEAPHDVSTQPGRPNSENVQEFSSYLGLMNLEQWNTQNG